MKIGSAYARSGRCEFTVWAPFCKEISVKVVWPEERALPMTKDVKGYWTATADGIPEGTLYYYVLDNRVFRPDPASHFQPEGVHGPSQFVDHNSDRKSVV